MSAALDGLLSAWPGDVAAFRRLTGSVGDWEALMTEAGREGVAGIIGRALVTAAIPVPQAAWVTLNRLRAAEELWLGPLESTLDDALRALDAARIRAVSLKGPVLAERLYPDARARFSADLDLLVAPADLERATATLAALGYVAESGPSGAYYRRHHHHIHLVAARPPMIELHFRAYAGFGVIVPAEPLVAASIPYRTARGLPTWVLAREDELLYLAIHAAGHCFERLLWLYDLKLLIQRDPQIDWTEVAHQVRRLGVATAASLACEMLRRRLGVAIPVMPGLEPPHGLRRLITNVALRGLVKHRDGARATLGRVLCMAALCDRPVSAAWFLQHHLLRTVRRRASRWFPRIAPLEWSA